ALLRVALLRVALLRITLRRVALLRIASARAVSAVHAVAGRRRLRVTGLRLVLRVGRGAERKTGANEGERGKKPSASSRRSYVRPRRTVLPMENAHDGLYGNVGLVRQCFDGARKITPTRSALGAPRGRARRRAWACPREAPSRPLP